MMAKSCKKGYYYCFTDKKCKRIPKGWHVMPSTGRLMRDSEHNDESKDETEGTKKNGNGNGSNGNGNGNGGSNGGSNGGGVSEAWSAKYKKSIDCDNPKGFSQKAHCRGRKIDEGKDGMSDHEVSMAKGQVRNSITNLKRVEKVLKTMTDKDDLPAWLQAKITDTEHNTDAAAGYMDEGTLHKWFKGSKSKDGKGGWVNVTTGGTCASDEPGEGVPKCVSRSKYESMTPAERRSASRRKKKKDKGQQSKRNAAKPTYVATDKPRKKMKESYSNWRTELDEGLLGGLGLAAAAYGAYKVGQHLKKKGDEALNNARQNATLGGNPFGAGARQRAIEKSAGAKPGTLNPNMQRLRNSYEPEGEIVEEGKDKKGKGSGTKDACYHKVKSRYSVWPSAYASGALVKCRKVGAANWGNSKKESFSNWREDMLLEGLEDKLKGMSASQIEDLIKANKGAEEKIRATLAKMRSATPNPQGKGAQLPNIPKQPASTSSATPRETYQRGGSDRVSYQRRQTVTRADVQGGTEAAKRAAAGQGRYRPGTGVTPDFKLDPKFKPPGSRGMTGGVRLRRGPGRIGTAIAVGSALAPLVMKGVEAVKQRFTKEDYDYSNWRDDFQATEYESVDLISNEPLQPTQGLGSDMLGEEKTKAERLKEISKQLAGASKMHAKQSKAVAKCADELEEAKKCWKGYKKAGTQKLFGKTYNRCVKAHFSDWKSELDLQEKEFKSHKMYDPKTGKGYNAETEKDHLRMKKMGYTHEKPEKKNCGCGKDPCETYGKQEVKEDWQKSNRKDGVDGMSQKSVNAYKRENPGSKLQTAVTEKKPKGKRAKRRKSFCARSKGQKDMHNIDCSKTPEKKICKARKRWRC